MQNLDSLNSEQLQRELDNAHARVLMARGDLKMADRMRDHELICRRDRELTQAIEYRKAVKTTLRAK